MAPEGEVTEQSGYWEMLINRSVQRFFLLASLHDRPMHGYELARAIREACSGCCQPTDAMIYPALHDLIAEGMVVCREETVGGRRRKVCSLTEKGEEAYREAARAWQRILEPLREAVGAALGCCPAESGEPVPVVAGKGKANG